MRKGEVCLVVQRLERLGLITAEDRQHSRLGPPRARLSATLEGPAPYRAGCASGGCQEAVPSSWPAWVKNSSRILSAFLLTCEEAIEATRPVTE